jgi:hypothetical protein
VRKLTVRLGLFRLAITASSLATIAYPTTTIARSFIRGTKSAAKRGFGAIVSLDKDAAIH